MELPWWKGHDWWLHRMFMDLEQTRMKNQWQVAVGGVGRGENHLNWAFWSHMMWRYWSLGNSPQIATIIDSPSVDVSHYLCHLSETCSIRFWANSHTSSFGGHAWAPKHGFPHQGSPGSHLCWVLTHVSNRGQHWPLWFNIILLGGHWTTCFNALETPSCSRKKFFKEIFTYTECGFAFHACNISASASSHELLKASSTVIPLHRARLLTSNSFGSPGRTHCFYHMPWRYKYSISEVTAMWHRLWQQPVYIVILSTGRVPRWRNFPY